MGKILFVLNLLMAMPIWALHIQNVSISAISEQAVNVSLTTAAEELYYFDSWQYSISGNEICVDAHFISGFGSTIAALNNNFEIPLNMDQSYDYLLKVRVFYQTQDNLELQDEVQLPFETPLNHTVELENSQFEKTAGFSLFPNPTSGALNVSTAIEVALIVDNSGREVKSYKAVRNTMYWSDLPDGIYKVIVFCHAVWISKTIILKK